VDILRYFDYLSEDTLNRVFYKKPIEFDKKTHRNILKYALGAFLYMPATQYDMIQKNISSELKGARPLAICLEDAVGASGEKEAIENVESILNEVRQSSHKNNFNLPIIFLRIKNLDQFQKIKDIVYTNQSIITGLLIPKANSKIIESFIELMDSNSIKDIYIMPIIETSEFIYRELKDKSFLELYDTVLKHRDRILSLRIGLTDILGLFGVRRSEKFSIYENNICSVFISDMVTYLNRPEIDIPVSGGVSEFFDMNDAEIKEKYIKEIELDKFHGLVGKTVIHPKQIRIVQALCSVSFEDYFDAVNIIESFGGKYGVSKSASGKRMNETNPHLIWAKRTIMLSKIYGVLNKGVTYEELLKF